MAHGRCANARYFAVLHLPFDSTPNAQSPTHKLQKCVAIRLAWMLGGWRLGVDQGFFSTLLAGPVLPEQPLHHGQIDRLDEVLVEPRRGAALAIRLLTVTGDRDQLRG